MIRTAFLLCAAIAFANIQTSSAQDNSVCNSCVSSACECQSVACLSGDCKTTVHSVSLPTVTSSTTYAPPTSYATIPAMPQFGNVSSASAMGQSSSYLTALNYQSMLARNPLLAQRARGAFQVAATPVIQQVPVTTMETQTVDRGNWQMVWISKPVQERVVRTTIQNRIAYQTSPVTSVFAAPLSGAMAAFANSNMAVATSQAPHGPSITNRLPMYAQAQTYTASPGLPILSAPGIPEIPTLDVIDDADDEASGPWLTVPSQSANTAGGQHSAQSAEERATRAPVPLPRDTHPSKRTRKRSRSRLFEPVRANSSVWQSQFTRRGSR